MKETVPILSGNLATLHCLQLLNDMLRDAGEATEVDDRVQTIQVALTASIHEVEQYDSSTSFAFGGGNSDLERLNIIFGTVRNTRIVSDG